MATASARNVCFTLNNYTDSEYVDIIGWKCKYIIVGKEIGDTGRTPHLQGYVEWNSSKRWETMKKLNSRIHWEARRGTAKEASDYCKKDGDFFESGSLSNQGERKDLDEIREALDEGVSMLHVAENNFSDFVRYHKGFERYLELKMTVRTEGSICHWYWGSTGTGKTFTARTLGKSFYIKDGTQWWPNYRQEEVIIIDDFDGRWPFRDFLRLTDPDGLPYQGQTKGGYININSKYLIITCEFPPEHYWEGNLLAQVLRRFCLVKEFRKNPIAAEVVGNTKATTF